MQRQLATSILPLIFSITPTLVFASNPNDVIVFLKTNACTTSCDLSGEDFSRSSHRYADLNHADVSWTDFSFANLDHVFFDENISNNATFQNSHMFQTKLGGLFIGANFSGATMLLF